MYKRFVSVMYVLNIVFQSFFNLLLPIALMAGLSWLLTEKAGAPQWIYVILLMLGVFTGLFSMIKFIISAMAGLERLEKQHREDSKKSSGTGKNKDETQES